MFTHDLLSAARARHPLGALGRREEAGARADGGSADPKSGRRTEEAGARRGGGRPLWVGMRNGGGTGVPPPSLVPAPRRGPSATRRHRGARSLWFVSGAGRPRLPGAAAAGRGVQGFQGEGVDAAQSTVPRRAHHAEVQVRHEPLLPVDHEPRLIRAGTCPGLPAGTDCSPACRPGHGRPGLPTGTDTRPTQAGTEPPGRVGPGRTPPARTEPGRTPGPARPGTNTAGPRRGRAPRPHGTGDRPGLPAGTAAPASPGRNRPAGTSSAAAGRPVRGSGVCNNRASTGRHDP